MDKLSYEFFRNLNITPNNYVFLYNVIVLKDTSIVPLIHDLQKLEDSGYLKIVATETAYDFHYTLKDFAYRLFEPKEESSPEKLETMFLEFWGTYPMKVGNRVLRSLSDKSQEAITIKKKLLPYIKVEGNFDKLMRGLNNELELRKKDNSMMFMQMVSTYVNQMSWQKYEDLEVTTIQERTKIGTNEF